MVVFFNVSARNYEYSNNSKIGSPCISPSTFSEIEINRPSNGVLHPSSFLNTSNCLQSGTLPVPGLSLNSGLVECYITSVGYDARGPLAVRRNCAQAAILLRLIDCLSPSRPPLGDTSALCSRSSTSPPSPSSIMPSKGHAMPCLGSARDQSIQHDAIGKQYPALGLQTVTDLIVHGTQSKNGHSKHSPGLHPSSASTSVLVFFGARALCEVRQRLI